MTELECRMKYKWDTGEDPTYGKYKEMKTTCNYEGALTPEYATWLENKDDGDKWKEDQFKRETALDGTYISYERGRRRKMYTKAYKEWLEKLECQKTT